MSVETEESNFYKLHSGRTVRCFVHEEVDGVEVAPRGSPFGKGLEDGREKFGWGRIVVPQAIESEEGEMEGYMTTFFIQITDEHGRSFELQHSLGEDEMRLVDAVLWQDEFGNYFCAISSKGSRVTGPRAHKSPVTPSGFAYHGMQDSDCLVRMIRASRLMREDGVDTEVILKIIEPKEIYVDGNCMEISEFKQYLKNQVWEANEDGVEEPGTDLQNVTREDIPELAAHLDKTKLLITIRALMVNERVQDFAEAETREEFERMVKKVFKLFNLREKLRKAKDHEYKAVELDFQSQDDIDDYFYDILPTSMILNLARLHERGLNHKYLHMGNMTGVGGICDLDSVSGAPLNLGDPEVNLDEMAAEAEHVVEMYMVTVEKLIEKGFVRGEKVKVKAGEGKEVDKNPELGISVFGVMLNYMTHRSRGKLGIFNWACKGWFVDEGFKRLEEIYPGQVLKLADELVPDLGWDYLFKVDLEEFMVGLPPEIIPGDMEGDLQTRLDKLANHITGTQELGLVFVDYLYELVRRDMLNKIGKELKSLAEKYGTWMWRPLITIFSNRAMILFMSELARTRVTVEDELIYSLRDKEINMKDAMEKVKLGDV
jgi:hypothetical protein